jgi:hypothetical protein
VGDDGETSGMVRANEGKVASSAIPI